MHNVKIEEENYFYFFEHFHKAFRGEKRIEDPSVLRSHPTEEIIAYCSSCQDKLCKICFQFESPSDSFFTEVKKNKLIQYYPTFKWKAICVIDTDCY